MVFEIMNPEDRVEIITSQNYKKVLYITEEHFKKQLEARYCSHCKGKPCIHLVKINFTNHGDYVMLGVCSKECEKEVIKKYK